MKYISIVVPVYNEQENVSVFYQEVCKHMEATGYPFELIFVDDGSSDETTLILKKLTQQDTRVCAIILARNFGHQVALTCGLDHARGDAVITMDGDMQHPPAMLPLLIKKWENGFEVVQTIRKDTQGVSWFKGFTSRMFYRTINAMSNIDMAEGGSDFRLLDRKVVDTFKNFKEKARFIRGIIGAMGYRRIQIEFVAPQRFAGKSKFSLKKMLNFALDGITAYSKLPLRLAFYMGLLSGLLSLFLTVDVVYTKLFTTEAVPGWATIAASVLLLGGLQLVGLGIIGEYIGRIFEEVKERPLYWISDELKSSVEVRTKKQETVA
ncbi:glycosyltransferase family 2 protein [Sporomusa sp. KB1]|jgi:dolichol-phosphate mannosyltransferase|uniref:glycosyltransferase family 2 protein n=1 Tax=Sporomusa sp. KB1 TaxID=943346 RepID=UPI0011A4AAF8|nr:glycosyltransferase family 2 protein [Sporomusa sp. KB1]TWH49140.1 dolichol-phosphate mannosyltransferase [Sporomusa sp. KB1]